MKLTTDFFKKYLDSDTLLSMVMLVVFMVAFATTFTMEGVSTYLLPRLLSGTGTVITLAIVIVKFRRCASGAGLSAVKPEKPMEGIPVFYTVLFTIGYFLLIRYTGFILTTTVAIWLFAFLMRLRKKLTVIVVGVVLPIVLHLCFVTLLKINLPEGIIESILPF